MPKVSGYSLGKLVLATLMLMMATIASAQYQLKFVPVDKDSAFLVNTLGLETSFANRLLCNQYINNLTNTVKAKGYPSASIDSIWADTSSATVKLFIGEAYRLANINTASIDKRILEAAGWNEKNLLNKPLDAARLQQLKENLVAWFEENGYPFAKIQFDSMRFENAQVSATLKIDKGPQYKIDSLRIIGNVKINNVFIQRY